MIKRNPLILDLYLRPGLGLGLSLSLSLGLKLSLSLSLLLFSLSAFAQMRLEIIPLQHRPADTLVSQLRPLVDDGGSLQASGNQIIIRSNPQNIIELHLLIEALDIPLAQFMISVRHGQQTGLSERRIEANTTIRHGNTSISTGGITTRSQSNDGASIGIDNNTRIIVQRSTRQGQQSGTHQLRATEGFPAYIQTGSQVPITLQGRDEYGRYREQQYKDVLQGVYVTPHLIGDHQVGLAIRTQHDSLKSNTSKRRPEIEVANYEGYVHGRLGEWIALGSLNQSGTTTNDGIARRHSTRTSKNLDVYLKIDRISN